MPWPEEPTSDMSNFHYVSPKHMDISHTDNVDNVDVHQGHLCCAVDAWKLYETQVQASPATPSSGALQTLNCSSSKLATGSTTYCKPLFNWWDCKTFDIDFLTEAQLAEYLIGHLITLQFPADCDYWLEEGGVMYAGEAFDTPDPAHPNPVFNDWQCLKFYMSVTSGPKRAKKASDPQAFEARTDQHLVCLSLFASEQTDSRFTSAFHDSETRNWKEARASPQWEMWKAAEAIELKTIWKMGTFETCDKQQGHIVPTLTDDLQTQV
eukprot:1514064-Rhodomonas_salina.1